MTEQMGEDRLDREIRAFLAWQAEDVVGAPTVIEMAARIVPPDGRRQVAPRSAPRLVWVLVAALAIAALLGALAVGAGALRRDPVELSAAPVSYEAVFLRLEVTDGTTVVTVVGVDAGGRERPIARLPGAWVDYGISAPGTYLAPVGVVSPSGLLAIPTEREALMMHWVIYDLHAPQAEPVAVEGMDQFIEQLRETPYFWVNARGGAFWGPGERLAILWYPPVSGEVHLRLGVVDGRTGVATPVDIPGGAVVLPAWAADGSGVLVAGRGSASESAGDVVRVLRQDGSVVDAPASLEEPSCRVPGGFELACLAPNDSMIVDMAGGSGPALRGASIVPRDGSGPFQVPGSFAGWLEAGP